MSEAVQLDVNDPILPDLFELSDEALGAVDSLLAAAREAVARKVAPNGKIDADLLDAEQYAAHGFAWLATYAEALRVLRGWAERLREQGRFGELERLILQVGFGEYMTQMVGGLPMSQNELFRPHDLGLDDHDVIPFLETFAVQAFSGYGNMQACRMRIARLIAYGADTGSFGDPGLDDDSLEMVRDQIRRFGAERIVEQAHEWHLKDALIPIEVIRDLAELGVFGLTVPEAFGGLGMGKTAMCLVSEELSRAYIGCGSLGTRSEIACELIQLGGTPAQKKRWLPGIASGAILPTAVFTEPNVGSDLGSLKTRAVRDGDVYRITGAKTWITHASRTDAMTLLARTDPNEKGYRGLSMFIAPKPRGAADDPFPAKGMTGGEIGVLGYRGMKEYELAFDDFEVSAENLLGGIEGQGFKQLMATFESARIQTAARAVGVAQNAMELGLAYARDRMQFGKPIYAFPRVAGKIAMMAVETTMARQLAYHSAREKDSGRRCDIEAGMAKLLGARVAWTNADNALQVHGGNGYALEYKISRVLCDARILNIFEGAAEIQAQVIARGLLGGRN